MTSTRKLRKQSKEIWEQMQKDNPELKQPTFCDKHPKICKAGKTAAAIGVGTVLVAGEFMSGTSQGVSIPIKSDKKKTDAEKKSATSKKKSTGTVKKKSPATAQKRATAKKSATPKKKSTVKKKTARKPKDDGLDYWRII